MTKLVTLNLGEVYLMLQRHQYEPFTGFCKCGDGDVYDTKSAIEHQIALMSHMDQQVDSRRSVY